MTALAIADHTTFFERYRNTGASDESKELHKLFIVAVTMLRERSVVWNRAAPVEKELTKTYQECAINDWDGYGALAVSASVYEEALKLVNLLPSWLPLPDVTPESNGNIGFEWHARKDRVFAASVRGEGIIIYAGLMGKGNKIHGTENFDDAIPAVVISSIRRVFS